MATGGDHKYVRYAVIFTAFFVFFSPLSAQEYGEDSPVELIENDDTVSEPAEEEVEKKVAPKKQKKKLKKKKGTVKTKAKKTETPKPDPAMSEKNTETAEKSGTEPGDEENENSISEVTAFQAAPEHPDFLYDTRSIPGLKDFDSAWTKSGSEKSFSETEAISEKKAAEKPTEFKFKMPDINLTQILVIGGALLLFILYQIQVRKKMRNRR